MDTKKILELQQYIESADLALQQARDILVGLGGKKISDKLAAGKAKKLITINDESNHQQTDKIIEGVFNGQNMVGSDGKEYSVPANYASKSKLVEGDILKLTIQKDGSFLYKQINPVQRARIKGKLVMDELTGQYAVIADDGKKYNVLTASVTFFKGKIGDQATILIPKDRACQWAAIENIFSSQENKFKDTQQLSDNEEAGDEFKDEVKKESNPPKDTKKENYQGITQYAKPDSLLSEIGDSTKQLADASGGKEIESQQEKERIEKIINNMESTENENIDDLDKEDLEEL